MPRFSLPLETSVQRQATATTRHRPAASGGAGTSVGFALDQQKRKQTRRVDSPPGVKPTRVQVLTGLKLLSPLVERGERSEERGKRSEERGEGAVRC